MKKFLLCSFFAMSFMSVLVTATAQTADEVIDKYIAAIGGKEKWKKINTLKMDGQIEVSGIEIPFTMQAVNQKGVRIDADFQGNKIIEITTPTQGWAQNPPAGKTTLQPMSTEELRTKLDELDLQGAFIDYKEKGSTVEALGKDEEDGNEYFKIKLTTKNKNETTYFFDQKTNLIYKQEAVTQQQGQDMKITSKPLDYKETDFGVKMPFKIDLGGTMLVTKTIAANVPIDEKIFSDK